MFKILMLMSLVANANNDAPTNIFCKAGNRGDLQQMYCGSSWADISRLPLIEGRFEDCSSALSRGVLILRVGGSVMTVEDPEFPFEVTLNDTEIICDEVNYLIN